MDEVLKELRRLGLSEKEAQVYVASLELGPATVQDISHKSRVNRATTYVMIEALSERGLMSSFQRGKKRYFVPESPDHLKHLLRHERTEIEQKEESLGKVLPMLLALFNVEGAKPQIRYLEGPEGLQSVRDTFVALKGEYMQIVPLEEVKKMGEIVSGKEAHIGKLAVTSAKHRTLMVARPETVDDTPLVKDGEYRILPPEKFPLYADITVRENHVFFFSYRSSILSVIIVSKEVADAVRMLFDLAWAGAKEFPERRS
ncbi:hypothetical protein A2856_03370 [Candidatus Uhrbacteria bacterium RIFCSPHIGHO2_01_FULL_63_20]|uniref:Transcription regulator TrmB N-terminal domain-containing protein n=1 Tax=Candidatus Uhrbacteria bacterium RIFCSPHIGHO2_01_FULL_63_20 TaxID=1802385 RepID=A0A1F7TLD2_9BACT|nr:MAG: hypothetical protein A2856_03370 [Candidatus Uhrbacteria bacterium RIFCSPHIGHO2_01_FULL_63_20]